MFTVLGLGVALPWLWPFATGPSATVDPWLFSAFMSAALVGIGQPRRPALLLLGAIALAGCLATWLSPAWAPLSAGAFVIASCACVSHGCRLQQDFTRMLTTTWAGAALLSSGVALCQYFGLAERFHPFMNASQMGEAFAHLRQRNLFASLLAIGTAAVLWRVGQGARLGAGLGAVALMAVACAATASRTGVLALVVVAFLATAWSGGRRRHVALTAGLGLLTYLVAAAALPRLLEAFTGVTRDSAFGRMAQDYGCSSRAVLWSNVLELIALKPWAGWGWGELDYAHYMTLYAGPRFCDILDNAHNLPLHLAVELGVPAALAVCGLTLWLVLVRRPWREAVPARQVAWMVLAVILLHGMVEYPLWYGPFQMAFGLCVGLLWRRQTDSAGPCPGASAAAPAMALAVATAMATSTTLAWWDYHRVSQLYLAPQQRSAAYQQDTFGKVSGTWLFRDQVHFAELTTTPLTRDNAAHMAALAETLLHFSPEPRVVERLIESLVLLGRDPEAQAHLARYRAAFPAEYRAWSPPTRDGDGQP